MRNHLMTFKICTIGCGSMASHVHGPSYRAYAALHDDTVLAACCDLDEGKAERFREAFGFRKRYRDIDTMLDAEKPDAVCLVAPERLTARLSMQVMDKGYPLLMEKPPGLDVAETTAMIETAERVGVATQVAFNRRYMPLVRQLKRQLEKRFLPSDIQHIRYDFYRIGRLDDDFAATAIHGVDAVKFIAGSDYANVRFHYQPIPNCGPQVVNMEMVCEFESGARAYLSFHPVSGVLVERAVVHAPNHSFFLNLPVEHSLDEPGALQHYEAGELQTDEPDAAHADESDTGSACAPKVCIAGGFYDENARFFDDIKAGRRPVGDLRSALQSVEIADCMRKRLSNYTKL